LVETLEAFQTSGTPDSIDGPGGMILVAGPVGSGKRTTLYSLLNYLNNDQTSLCTVEETVKSSLRGVHQSRTQPEMGLTTCKAFRSSLQQDPDVVMVDHVDDKETAHLSFQAAMSGLNVMSSLYAFDGVSAVNRLQSMGLESSMIARTLRLLISQRRVRRLCDACKQPVQVKTQDAIQHGIPSRTTVFEKVGCKQCRHTGYQGYGAIFEVVRVAELLSAELDSGTAETNTARALGRLAAERGIKSLWRSLAEALVSGVTDLSEASRLRLPQDQKNCTVC
jgi:type II secretory ATPase GspE/PulE/Tfp pilus assembly ATPase PilB-like protein